MYNPILSSVATTASLLLMVPVAHGAGPYGVNLLQNPDGETGDLSGWVVPADARWRVDNPGFGTSYQWATKEQVVDLMALGFSEEELDQLPHIEISETFHKTFCRDWYFLDVELLDADYQTIARFYSGEKVTDGECNWLDASNTEAHRFPCYGKGVRYIRWRDGGKDREYWGGFYGARLSDARLIVHEPGTHPVYSYCTGNLEIAFTSAYEVIWKDAGSGAHADVSFWRPAVGEGWQRLGHHAKAGWSFPDSRIVKVREVSAGTLASPTGYSWIWNDVGSGAHRDVSVWRPDCPADFRALGDVTTPHYGQPSLDEVTCVRDSELTAAGPGSYIWHDRGSGASHDFAAWAIQRPPSETFGLTAGLFYSNRGWNRPHPDDVDVLWAIKADEGQHLRAARLLSDHFYIDYVYDFEWIWNDRGSEANRDVGIFRPMTREGYYALGHLVVPFHGQPTDALVMTVKEKQFGALAPPDGYREVWNDRGSGAHHDVYVWMPICPDGYEALGILASPTSHKPTLDAVRCVREDLTVAAAVGDLTWNHHGSGADRPFAAWEIETNIPPAGEAHINPGIFVGAASVDYEAVAGQARALRLQLPILISSDDALQVPELIGFSTPPPSIAAQTITKEVFVPFTAVKDEEWTQVKMARESPYYRMVSTEKYELINHLYNATDHDQTSTWSYSQAFTEAESFTRATGVSVTHGFTVGKENVASMSVSVTFHESFTYERYRSETSTTTIELPITAQPHSAVAAYAVRTSYRLYRADGTLVSVHDEPSAFLPRSAVIVQYRE